jgi:HTH-type transcriptional regulator/antitoxin HigA
MARKPVRPIRTEADYEAALDEIEEYFENEPKPGSLEGDRFELLALVIEDYEEKHWPIDPPDPVDAIRYRMETGGFTQTDLGRLLGSRQRASDILARRRPITLEMAWKLHREWDVRAEALLQPQVPASPRGHRIASSAIREVRYSAPQKKLFVTFTTGREYVYEQVPQSVFRQLKNSASKGTYFNQNNRDHYPFRELLVA